eukprot:6176971-Pleurochrysis_carterae.AAC.3
MLDVWPSLDNGRISGSTHRDGEEVRPLFLRLRIIKRQPCMGEWEENGEGLTGDNEDRSSGSALVCQANTPTRACSARHTRRRARARAPHSLLQPLLPAQIRRGANTHRHVDFCSLITAKSEMASTCICASSLQLRVLNWANLRQRGEYVDMCKISTETYIY